MSLEPEFDQPAKTLPGPLRPDHDVKTAERGVLARSKHPFGAPIRGAIQPVQIFFQRPCIDFLSACRAQALPDAFGFISGHTFNRHPAGAKLNDADLQHTAGDFLWRQGDGDKRITGLPVDAGDCGLDFAGQNEGQRLTDELPQRALGGLPVDDIDFPPDAFRRCSGSLIVFTDKINAGEIDPEWRRVCRTEFLFIHTERHRLAGHSLRQVALDGGLRESRRMKEQDGCAQRDGQRQQMLTDRKL